MCKYNPVIYIRLYPLDIATKCTESFAEIPNLLNCNRF